MAEFDFDELDKAVSSLMQKQTGSTEAPNDHVTSAQVAQPTTQQSPVNKSADDQPQQSVAPRTTTATDPTPQPDIDSSSRGSESATRPSLVPKRRGQFMDVVHPSAKVTPASNSPAKPVRQGATLQPVSSNIQASAAPTRSLDGVSQIPTADAQSTAKAANYTSSETSLNDTATTEEASEWPDPLDMMENRENAEKRDAPSKSETSPLDSLIAASEQESTGANNPSAMDSPFLPDAKVEKRPLGPSATQESLAETIDETSETTEAQTPAVEPAVSLPEELHSDVLSLESHSTSNTEQSNSDSEGPIVPTEVTSATTETTQTATDSPTNAASDSSPKPSPSLIGALPPRQASPAASADTSDDTHNSIFDTDDHHPMKHHAKPSSGWFAVVIIGSMLVIGAIGGVIFYLLNNGY